MKPSLRFVVVHYHILKNAGSTVEEFLGRSFEGRYLRFEAEGSNSVIGPAELLAEVEAHPEVLAVSSHHTRYPLPEKRGILFFDLCFLRDPLDRARSIYDYYRLRPAPGEPVSDLANRSAIGDFMEGLVGEHALQVRDVQVNLIAQAGNSDEPVPADLELAWERMRESSFLGVVDRFNESLVAGQYFLNAVFPTLQCAVPAVNASKGFEGTVESRTAKLREACRPDVFAELLRITALDSELLRRAREEVRRRFLTVPDREARLARLEGVLAGRSDAPKRAPINVPAKRLSTCAVSFPRRLANAIVSAPAVLRRTPLFDAVYYRERYGNFAFPKLHFLFRGAFEGAQPHELFDASFYLRHNPGVLNPLADYIATASRLNTQPHPLFDANFYLERNPDVRASGMNPLAHYIAHGSNEGRKPHPWFQPDYYLEQCPEAGTEGGNPLAHFAASAHPIANPHRLFDCEEYLKAHPDVAERRKNPLVAALSVLSAPAGPMIVDDIPLDPGEVPVPPERRRFLGGLNPRQAAIQSEAGG
jgi:hypothetical protein